MMMDNDVLKYISQCSRLMYVLAMLTIFSKYLFSLTITLRCFHETLSGLGADKLLHLSIVLMSRSLKMDLIFISPFHFYFILFFIFDLFSIFRTRVRVKWQRSQVTRCKEGRRRFWKDNVIQCVKHMLALWYTHGCLG